jgi:hypothetical protein
MVNFLNHNFKRIVGILLMLFWAKSVVWLFLFPVFQTPDEIRHYDYILHLAKGHHFPNGPNQVKPQDYYMQETIDLAEMASFHRLVYRPSQKTNFLLTNDSLATVLKNYSETNAKTTIHDFEEIYLFAYEPGYYLLNAVVYYAGTKFGLNLLNRFYLLRMFSVLLIFLTLLVLIRIFRILLIPPVVQLAILWLLIFWPQFSMFSISIQPDVLSLFIVVLIVWLVLKSQKKPNYILLGLLIGVLGFVKFQFFATVLFGISIVWIIDKWRSKRKLDYKYGITILLATLIASIWLVHNYYYYHALHPGDPLLASETTLWYKFYLFLLVFKSMTLKSYVAYLGWLDTLVPNYIYMGFLVFVVASIASAFKLVWKKLGEIKRTQAMAIFDAKVVNYLYVFLPFLTFAGLMLFVAVLYSPLVNSQGRIYFPFIIPQVLLLVYFPWKIFAPKKIANYYLAALSMFLFIIHVHSVFIIFARYYG